jgi:hypothetical protein
MENSAMVLATLMKPKGKKRRPQGPRRKNDTKTKEKKREKKKKKKKRK